LLRHVVTKIFFGVLKKFAARTETTLDDKLFPAMEAPVAAFITVLGIFAALNALKLSPEADRAIGYGSTIAFSLVIFWGLLRAFNAVLDHAHEIAVEKQMGVAAFMPWIKKALVAIFIVIGALMVIQSLGYNVSTLLQGLGIGGLAFALAAQDTIANLFGSLVVATDQPFKIGETIRVGSSTGAVEDIGLRSTKIRLTDKSLVVVPNKMMASEAIVNLSRFTQRRVDQVIGLTYDTTPEQMETILADFRALLASDEGIAKETSDVYFTEYADSSLNIQITYYVSNPDYRKHLALRERINLKIMRAVAARGLSMAFPTQTLLHDGPLVKQLAAQKN
jgi:MscS family membrane protein